jgi:GTPase SAR1 family protein
MANNKNTSEKSRKLVIVGDGMSGKTCLLHAYVHNSYHPTHTPTIFDTLATEIVVNDKKVR